MEAMGSGYIDAAGDVDALAGHETRGIGKQEHHDVGDVLRRLQPPERRLGDIVVDDALGAYVAQLRLPGDLALLHAGLDEARTDGVDADARRRKLARQRLRPAE